MGGNNGKNVIRFDRNRAAGPWAPLMGMEITEEGKQAGVVAAFRNNRFAIYIKNARSEGLLMQGPMGQPQPTPVVHLIVVGASGRAPTYAEAQRIKNELVHEESDMVEIYPARSREIEAPQTHFWCLPPGYRLPLGLVPAAAAAEDRDAIPGVVKRSELQFYVVETPQPESAPIVEVFSDEADARASYEASGAAFPEGGALRMLGMVPTEEEGAGWSAGAQARREALMERIGEAGRKMAEEEHAVQSRALMPLGNPSVEEELEAGGEFGTNGLIDGPMEPEEAARLEDLMRAGMARHATEREAVISEEIKAKHAAGEEEAAESLEAMRRQLVQTGKIEAAPTAPDGEDKPN